jgi:hypothetical protein
MKTNSIWQPQQPRVHNQLDFDVGEPSSYRCSILRYTHGHRQLVVEVVRKEVEQYEPVFYLSFETVWYFQGPVSWSGVDFELDDINEQKAILERGFLNVEENMIEAFAKQHELFLIQKPTFSIQILAANCFMVKNISES